MKTKVLVSLAMLVGIGAILHFIMPPLFMGMRPDMLLVMMFLGILLFPEKKNVLVLALGTGVVSALTTTFPGGQIANMIDKPITAFVFLALYLATRKLNDSVISATILTAIGTIISGSIFIGSASILFGLEDGATFLGLFGLVVLPATAVNAVVMIIIYPIVKTILKRTSIITPQQI